jgi:hypothetical protein
MFHSCSEVMVTLVRTVCPDHKVPISQYDPKCGHESHLDKSRLHLFHNSDMWRYEAG